MSKSNCDPHKRFAAALLLRAAKDARQGNERASEARRWLCESVDAGDLLDALSISPDVARTWAEGTQCHVFRAPEG